MSYTTLVTGKQPQYLTFGATRATSTASVGPSNSTYKDGYFATIQVISTGTVTAYLQGTNEDATANGTNSNWVNLATLTLPRASSFTGDTTTSDGAQISSAWKYVRVYVGTTTATVSFLLGL